MATGLATRQKSGQRSKSIEDVVSYAISHRTRVHLLIVLNEGIFSAVELSDLIGEPLKNVAGHLNALCEAGAIELAETRKRRNFDQHFYRAIQFPVITREGLIEMHPIERQFTVGLHVQSLLAEIMASLWSGKISEDPDHCFIWDRVDLDEEGHREMTAEETRHWQRLKAIERKSKKRVARNGQVKTAPYIIAVLGFLRGRTSVTS